MQCFTAVSPHLILPSAFLHASRWYLWSISQNKTLAPKYAINVCVQQSSVALHIFNSAINDEQLLCVSLSLHQYGPNSKCLRTNSSAAAICPRPLRLRVKLRLNADIPGLGPGNMRPRLLNVQPSTHTDVWGLFTVTWSYVKCSPLYLTLNISHLDFLSE